MFKKMRDSFIEEFNGDINLSMDYQKLAVSIILGIMVIKGQTYSRCTLNPFPYQVQLYPKGSTDAPGQAKCIQLHFSHLSQSQVVKFTSKLFYC